jgi:serine protease
MTRGYSKVAGAALATLLIALRGSQPQARQEPVANAGEPVLQDPERAAAILTAFGEGLDAIPGEVLIKFRPGTGAAAMQSVMALAPRPTRGSAVRWIGETAVLPIDDSAPVAAVADRLAREPEVEYAQPNYLRRLRSTPNDPGLTRQWNFTAIDMPRAWDINPGAVDVLVAVVDSGVTSTTATVNYRLWTGARFETVPVAYRMNPDIDAGRFAGARDTTSLRLTLPGFATQPVFDSDGHGTHVAGTILQTTNNSLGYAGMAYRARLLSVKSCMSYWDIQFAMSAAGRPGFTPPDLGGGCATSDVLEGIRFAADNGAKMINLSLGGETTSPAEREAITYAVGKGAFVAIAMGNEFEEGNPIEYPAFYAASIDGAMSVGAVGRSLRRAFYSNTGSHLEIAAPGGDSRDGGLAGVIYQTGLFEPDFDPEEVILPRFDRYTDSPNQGTSMATPHVIGLAALLYSQGITNPAAIEAAIKRFARDLGPAGPDTQFGAGLIDPPGALRGLGLAR